MRSLGCLAIATVLWSGASPAGTSPGSITRQSLLRAADLTRWSVGADVAIVNRDITVENGPETTLKTTCADLFLAYDFAPAVFLFITGGVGKGELEGFREYADYRAKWSVGLGANVWSADIESPRYLVGTLSLKALAEFADHTSEDVDTGERLHWTEVSAALPLYYEIAEEDDVRAMPQEARRLALHVGPAVSSVRGDYDQGSGNVSFDGDSTLGFVAGVDIYLAANLCLSAEVASIGGYTYSGGLRFHF
jgi:hypothetical protein